MGNWKLWLHGLFAAVIGAVAASVGLMVADPAAMSDWSKIGKAVGFSALITAAAYLKQSPLPPTNGGSQ